MPSESISQSNNKDDNTKKRKFNGSGCGGGKSEIQEDSNKEYTKNYVSALYNDSLVMNYAESSEPVGEDDVVLVDSACNVLAINRERLFSNLDKSKTRKIKTAQRKSVVHVKDVGDVSPLKNAYWCPDNLCGVNVVKDMGYTSHLNDY
jgi:hypothetical protein